MKSGHWDFWIDGKSIKKKKLKRDGSIGIELTPEGREECRKKGVPI